MAQALDSEQAHTSFGKLPLSVEKTAQQFSFPQAKREDQAKVFIQDLTKQENMGKLGPAPIFFEDNIKYKDVSKIQSICDTISKRLSLIWNHSDWHWNVC